MIFTLSIFLLASVVFSYGGARQEISTGWWVPGWALPVLCPSRFYRLWSGFGEKSHFFILTGTKTAQSSTFMFSLKPWA